MSRLSAAFRKFWADLDERSAIRRAPVAIPAEPSSQAVLLDPVAICCYLHDRERDAVIANFGLDDPARRGSLDIVFHKDVDRLGPERSFQRCWEGLPGRDIVILHPDMWPTPGDASNRWFADLLEWARRFPKAGILGCTLLDPLQRPPGTWRIESGGGYFRNGEVCHVGARRPAFAGRLLQPRLVDWATFGGVYLRRSVIDAVGGFDPRYEWAYFMDVDYCLEAQARGFDIVQVPAALVHAANGSAAPFLARPEYRAKKAANEARFKAKWAHALEADRRTGS